MSQLLDLWTIVAVSAGVFFCVWLLVLLASATASQLIARVARRSGPPA